MTALLSRRVPRKMVATCRLPLRYIMLALVTTLNAASLCWNLHKNIQSQQTVPALVMPTMPSPTVFNSQWNGTFDFLRPRWNMLREFLDLCADLDGSEGVRQGNESHEPWVRAVRPIFSVPGPSFATAVAALNHYQQVVSTRPTKKGRRRVPYTCMPWVLAQGPAPQLGRALRVAMVTLCTTNLLEKAGAAMALQDKREYCNRHGYDLHAIAETVPGREAAWAKLPGILSLLHRYDWIVSLDLDTVILDHRIPLEEFLDPHHDIIIGVDYNGINSGVFFLRNSTWSRALLIEAWTITDEPMSRIWWEQSALMRLVKIEGVRNHVKYCPQVYFNSYTASETSVDRRENGGRGPFIVHFAGIAKKWDILPDFYAQRRNVENKQRDDNSAY